MENYESVYLKLCHSYAGCMESLQAALLGVLGADINDLQETRLSKSNRDYILLRSSPYWVPTASFAWDFK